jgi:hypothetical protein
MVPGQNVRCRGNMVVGFVFYNWLCCRDSLPLKAFSIAIDFDAAFVG